MMKKILKTVLFLSFVLTTGPLWASQKAPALIPYPAKLELKSGSFKTDAPAFIQVYPASSDQLKSIAAILSDMVKRNAGVTVQTSDSPRPGANKIVLEIAARPELSRLGDEAYLLEVASDTIKISAPNPHGVFNGAMTLAQLFAGADKSFIPGLSIIDYPRFPHRGLLLDPARNFLSIDMLKNVIDKMAQLKLNVLHFHLVDDQGWRFESKIFPKLQQVGGATGYYTQDQLRDLVKYGSDRFVTIMPEIEMPGHSSALLASYPELSCSGEKINVSAKWGIHVSALCPGKPEVYDFLDKLIREVAGVFPSYYIHTGSDEVTPTDWQSFAPNQELEKNLSDKNNKGLQCYFINKVNQTFLSIDRRMTVWDEMVDCLPEGARAQAWRSIGAVKVAADANHEVVVSLVNPWYLDYPDWPWQLKKVYLFDPVPADLAKEKEKFVVGGQGNLWGERAPEKKIMPKLFPRLIAISEVLWSPKDARDWDSFKSREARVRGNFEKQGVQFFIWLNITPM
jgi:hexosaminidase